MASEGEWRGGVKLRAYLVGLAGGLTLSKDDSKCLVLAINVRSFSIDLQSFSKLFRSRALVSRDALIALRWRVYTGHSRMK